MNIERISVIELANIIGKSDILIPYNNQEKTPTVKMMNIDSEISFVLFVLYTLIAWGKNAIVVQNAAKKPIYLEKNSKTIISYIKYFIN